MLCSLDAINGFCLGARRNRLKGLNRLQPLVKWLGVERQRKFDSMCGASRFFDDIGCCRTHLSLRPFTAFLNYAS